MDSPDAMLDALASPSQCTNALSERIHTYLAPALQLQTGSTVASTRTQGLRTSLKDSGLANKENKRPLGRSTTRALKGIVENVESLATRLGPFAMKIVNQTVKTLAQLAAEKKKQPSLDAKCASPFSSTCKTSNVRLSRTRVKSASSRTTAISKLANTRHRPASNGYGAIECLANCSRTAIEALEALEKNISIQPYDIERVTCNVATRLIDVEEYDIGLKMLVHTLSRLWPETKTPSSSPSKIAEAKQRKHSITTGAPSRSRTTKNSGSGITPVSERRPPKATNPETLLHLPSIFAEEDSTARLSLSLTSVTVALRYYLSRPEKLDVDIEKLVMHPSGIHASCKRLKMIDVAAGAMQFGNVFRILYNASINDSERDPAVVLKLRKLALSFFVESSNFNIAAFGGHALKFAMIFEQSARQMDPGRRMEEMLDYYSTILQHFEALLRQGKKPDIGACKWCEHCLGVAKKLGHNEIATRVLNFTQTILGVGQLQITPDLPTVSLLTASRLEAFILQFRSNSGGSEIQSAGQITADVVISSLRTFRASVSEDNVHLDKAKQSLNSFLRILDSLNSLSGELTVVADVNSDLEHEAHSVNHTWRDIYFEATRLHTAFLRLLKNCLSASEFDTYTRKLLPGVIVCYNMLARLDSIVHAGDTTTFTEHLRIAAEMSTSSSFSEGMRWTANTYYVLGGNFYKQKCWHDAGILFAESATLLRRCLEQNESIPTGSDRIRTEVTDGELLLCKRYSLGAQCRQMTADYTEALSFLREAFLILKPWFSLCLCQSGARPSPVDSILRLVDHYVRIRMLMDPAAYIPVLDFIDCGFIESSEDIGGISSIAQYELKLLQAGKSMLGQLQVVNLLLRVYENESFPIRKARTLIEKAKLLRCIDYASHEGENTPLACCEAAVELLKTTTIDGDCARDEAYLKQSENDLAIAYSLWGMMLSQEDRYQAKPFSIALRIWKKLLRRVPLFLYNSKPTIENPKAAAYFADLKATYYHIYQLADYLEMLNQPLNRIICLRLLLRLTTLLTDNEDIVYDAASLHTNIGYAYLILGYTGQAGIALAQGRALVEAKKCTAESAAYCQLCYSYYLCCIGNLKKSESVFKKVAAPPSAGHQSKSTSKWFERVQSHSGASLQAFAFVIYAHICLRSGKLAQAIAEAQNGLRLLIKAVKKLKVSSDGDGMKDLTDAMCNVNLNEGRSNSSTKNMHDKLLRSTQWHLVQRFLNIYMWLGQLYVHRGSVREADHFYQQGLQLATSVRSQVYLSEFLLCLAELDYRRYLLEESGERIQGAVECHAKVSPDIAVRDVVLSKLHSGDQHLRGEAYSEALAFFAEAEALLDEAMTERTIASLEEKDVGALATPREKKIVHLSPIKRKKASSLCAGLEGAADADIQNECSLLAQTKLGLLSRAGWALCKQGRIEEAENRLFGSDEIEERGSERVEYLVTIAKLKCEKVFQVLRSNSLFSMFSESAFSLPWNVPKVPSGLSRQTKSFKAALALKRSLSRVEELFKEAFTLSYPSGSPQMVHEICHGLALLNMMRAHLAAAADDADPVELALTSTFYLEMAKGLTVRREMLSLIYDKMDRQKSGQKVSWPAMTDEQPPKAENEDGLYELHKNTNGTTGPDCIRDIISSLPDTWIVCSISIDLEREDLYVTRLEKDAAPVVVRLPLRRQEMRGDEGGGLGYSEVLGELQDILESSTVTTKDSASCITKEEKLEWWKRRKELDGRLKKLLETVEEAWLGAFRGMFTGDDYDSLLLNDAFLEFKESMERIIFNTVSRKARKGRKPTILPIDPALCQMLLRLGPSPNPDEVEDALYYLMDAYSYSGMDIDFDEIDIDTLEIEVSSAVGKFHETYRELGDDSSQSRRHIILIPDKHLHMFPWESVPTLRNQAVSRVPSLFALRDILALHSPDGVLEIDRNNAYYLLNPSQDLANTEKTFKDIIKKEESWEGLVGQPPTEGECAEALAKKDLFLYFGHGGGEQYIHGHRVRELNRCAVSLLLGCSSGSLKPSGEFDPYGTPLNYLLGGSQAIVANLWDVTDGEIDKVSKKIFEEWGLFDQREARNGTVSVVEAVMKSRDACKLKYLTGAAPIVYGVPVYLRRGAI